MRKKIPSPSIGNKKPKAGNRSAAAKKLRAAGIDIGGVELWD